MTEKPVWSYEPPHLLRYHAPDFFFTFVMIAGYAIIHSYCEFLFLGPCNSQGYDFPLGVSLMILGWAGLAVYRVNLMRSKRVLAKILVFTEGTIIREKRDTTGKMVGGIMLGNAAGKLEIWKRQGAQITYLTSRRDSQEVKAVGQTLKQYRFPKGQLLSRGPGESYGTVAEKIMPNIIVEDDCASIGGQKEMTYPQIKPEVRSRIRSVVVREFAGIDSLPSSLLDL
jgi:hypothetical protein